MNNIYFFFFFFEGLYFQENFIWKTSILTEQRFNEQQRFEVDLIFLFMMDRCLESLLIFLGQTEEEIS